ncbi:hypothetical protein, partial [Sphingobacterium thalpophilum]|uniref:hypothetical protein n=1 Tax=Sphingobacterium thalpophilum TaxID=259 RepID=UPI003C7362A1
CPNPLDRWTIVFQTACSGTANRGRKGGRKPPGAGHSSAGPERRGQSSQLPGKMDGRLSRGLLRGRKIRPRGTDPEDGLPEPAILR